MDQKMTVVVDRIGNTLDVWFGKPQQAISEEVGDEIILKKDIKTGKVIGFEKLNYSLKNPNNKLPVDIIVQ